jgi:energy-coupling factor transport system ATP-binding protein
LDSVDMYEHRKMAPHLLSGGQKQRVAIAGVIAMKPEIIIFDEPTAMLDPEGRLEVMEIIKSLHQEGITVILITHFMEEAASADRIVIMSGGRIVLDGIPAEIFKSTEKIEELDLRLPFPIEIAARLRERGVAVPENVLTQEALAGYVVDVAKGWIPGQARDDNSSSRDDNSSQGRQDVVTRPSS